ncbi:hypothetical protein [Clostridium estertheticum]|nr:hypothetical protein [Clostridium estertheticum]
MRVMFSTIIATIINYALLVAIIIVVYKSIKGFKNRNKRME